ncbi:MAG: hypothetical protein WDW38_008064 [Sanguina aurantia]
MDAKITALQRDLLHSHKQAERQQAASLEQKAALHEQVDRLTAQIALLQQACSTAVAPGNDTSGTENHQASSNSTDLHPPAAAGLAGSSSPSRLQSAHLCTSPLAVAASPERRLPRRSASQGIHPMTAATRVQDWMIGGDGATCQGGPDPALAVPSLLGCSTQRLPANSRRTSSPPHPPSETFSLESFSSMSSITVPSAEAAHHSPLSLKCAPPARGNRASVLDAAGSEAGRSGLPSSAEHTSPQAAQRWQHMRSSFMEVWAAADTPTISHSTFRTPPNSRTPHSSFASPEPSLLPNIDRNLLKELVAQGANKPRMSSPGRPTHGAPVAARVRRYSHFALTAEDSTSTASHRFTAAVCATPHSSFADPNGRPPPTLGMLPHDLADIMSDLAASRVQEAASLVAPRQPALTAAAALFTPGATASLVSRFAAAGDSRTLANSKIPPNLMDSWPPGIPGSDTAGSHNAACAGRQPNLPTGAAFLDPDHLRPYPGWAPSQVQDGGDVVSRCNSSQMGQYQTGQDNDAYAFNHPPDLDAHRSTWSHGQPLPQRCNDFIFASAARPSRYTSAAVGSGRTLSDRSSGSGSGSVSSSSSSSSSSGANSSSGAGEGPQSSHEHDNTPSTDRGSAYTTEGCTGGRVGDNPDRPESSHSPVTPTEHTAQTSVRRGKQQSQAPSRFGTGSEGAGLGGQLSLQASRHAEASASVHGTWEFDAGAVSREASNSEGANTSEHFVFQQATNPSALPPASRIMSLVGLRRKHMGIRKQALFQSNLDEPIVRLEQEIESKKQESSRQRTTPGHTDPAAHLASQELALDLFSQLGTTSTVLQLEQQLVSAPVTQHTVGWI